MGSFGTWRKEADCSELAWMNDQKYMRKANGMGIGSEHACKDARGATVTAREEREQRPESRAIHAVDQPQSSKLSKLFVLIFSHEYNHSVDMFSWADSERNRRIRPETPLLSFSPSMANVLEQPTNPLGSGL